MKKTMKMIPLILGLIILGISCEQPVPVSQIDISEKELVLDVGKTAELTAEVLPIDATDKSFVWSSSDTEVAEVDQSGKVTAVGLGKADIRATAGNGIWGSCSVTVIRRAESISLNAAETTVELGDSFKLEATVLPEDTSDKTVTWVSSSMDIASVDDNGNVTAHKSGKTMITATVDGSIKAQCIVTVPVPVASVELDVSEVFLSTVKWGDDFRHEQQVTAKVFPEEAPQTVTWESSNPELVTVENGLIKAQQWEEGTAVITARTVNGKEAKCTVYVASVGFYIDTPGLPEGLSIPGNTWESGYEKPLVFTYSNPDLQAKAPSSLISENPDLIKIEGNTVHIADVTERTDCNLHFINEKLGIDRLKIITVCPRATSIDAGIPTDVHYFLKGDPRIQDHLANVEPQNSSKIIYPIKIEGNNPENNSNMDVCKITINCGISHFYLVSPFNMDMRSVDYEFFTSGGSLDANGMWWPDAGDNGVVYIPNKGAYEDFYTHEIMTVDTKGIYGSFNHAFWTTPPAGKSIDEVRILDSYDNFTVGRNAFLGSNLKKINLPANATVDQDAFAECRELHSVFVGKDVTVDPSAFTGCTALKTIWMEGADPAARPEWAPEGATIEYGKTLDEFYTDIWRPSTKAPQI